MREQWQIEAELEQLLFTEWLDAAMARSQLLKLLRRDEVRDFARLINPSEILGEISAMSGRELMVEVTVEAA